MLSKEIKQPESQALLSRSFPDLGFTSLTDLLDYRSTRQPTQTAFIFLNNGKTESHRLNYSELAHQARNVASHLQKLTQPGDRILLLYPPGLEFITAFFGCLYAGVIAIPLYPPRPNRSIARIKAIIADAQPKVGLSTTSVFPQIERRLPDNRDLQEIKWLCTDSLSDNIREFKQIPQITSQTLAFLQYTSGSTGLPKGVMVSHSNALHNSEYIKQAFDLTRESVSVSWLPHFHDMGLIDGILQPLYSGFLGVLMPPIAFLGRPIQWLQAVSHYQATHCGGPNFAYQLCVDKITAKERENLDLSSWTTAYNGAEPIRAETLERFTRAFQDCGFQAHFFYPCYGLAESTLMVAGGNSQQLPTISSLDAEALIFNQVILANENTKKIKKVVSCGHSWLDNQIIIVDPVSLHPCPPDKIGEIWVSGSSVAQGYWNNHDATEKTFQAHLSDSGEKPFLRTGDLGFIHNQELFITGRLKDVIIIKGQNYYPQDIEQTVAKSHPALRTDCGAAFSIDINGEEKLVIIQEVAREHRKNLDLEAIVGNICQSVMREYDLQIYDLVLIKTGSIPKTSSGKIQRLLCRENYLNNKLDQLVETITSHALGKNRI